MVFLFADLLLFCPKKISLEGAPAERDPLIHPPSSQGPPAASRVLGIEREREKERKVLREREKEREVLRERERKRGRC